MTTVLVNMSQGPPAKKLKNDIDCEQCGLVKSKYTCPKCGFRTCSLSCVKLHKEVSNCDGQRQQFDAVKKASQYNDEVSVKDQEFLHGVTEGLVAGMKKAKEVVQQSGVQKTEDKKGLQKIEESKEDEAEEDSDNVDEDDSHGLEIIDDEEKEHIEESDQSQSRFDVTQELPVNNNDQDLQPRDLNLKQNQEASESETQAVEESEFLKKYASGGANKFVQSLTRIEHNLIGSVTRRRIFINIESPSGNV